MKIFKAFFLVIGVVFSGCATYRYEGGQDSGVFKVGGYIWPTPQSEVTVVNNTTHLIELREGGNTIKMALKPAESFVLGYNVYNRHGIDLPLTAVIYGMKADGSRANLGMVFRTIRLRNSSGYFDRYLWVIEQRGQDENFYGYIR